MARETAMMTGHGRAVAKRHRRYNRAVTRTMTRTMPVTADDVTADRVRAILNSQEY